MAFKLNTRSIAGNILKGHSVKSSVLKGLASSGLSGILRSVTMSLLGGMTQSTVHITNLDSGDNISLAWTPEKISVSASGRFQNYDIIESGEVKIPRGLNLKQVKWNGKFPGESRTDYAFIHSAYWQEPKEIIKMLEEWREQRAKLRLLVTQTSVNLDVYLDHFSYDWTGGHGDADYDIEFVAAKDMIVKTVQEVDAERLAEQKQAASAPVLKERPSLSPLTGAILTTVATGNVWTAAQKALGDGAKWPEVLRLNTGKSGVSADKVGAGVRLKLPT